MKTVLGAVVLVLWAGGALAGDPVEGIWTTRPDDNGNFGQIEIAPCGQALCGTLIRSFDGGGVALDSENVGKRIVRDMMSQGGGYYDGGKVWAPDRDKSYTANLQLNGSSLAVSGCVLGGLICRASDWSRVV